MKRFTTPVLLALFALSSAPSLRAQEEDLAFRALRIKGNVMAYHNENDETARLYASQSVGDGDKVILGRDCEAVLRLKDKVYLYLAPRTKVNFQRLRSGDKGFQCRINLVTGRMLCLLNQPTAGAVEVSAGSVLCREHGSLFEVSRKGEELTVVSFQGAVVAGFHGKTRMAKDNEVLKINNGKFRNITHHLTQEQQGHLEAWRSLWVDLSANTPIPAAH